MCGGKISAVLTLLALAAAALFADVPVRAQDFAAQDTQFAPGSVCHASARAGETYATIIADRGRWVCDAGDWPDEAEQIVLRFDRRGAQAEALNATLDARYFKAVEVLAIGTLGSATTGSVDWEDAAVTSPVWTTQVAVPTPPGELTEVMVRVDGPRLPARLASVSLEPASLAAPVASAGQIMAAILCGLLLAPVLFDLGLFRVLRSSFPIYHAAFSLLAVIQTFAVAGLIPLFVAVSRDTQILIASLSFDFLAGAGALFAASFIEPDKLDDRGRRLLVGIGILAGLVGVVRTVFWEAYPEQIIQFYYLSYAIFMVGLLVGLGHPLRCGSRATYFLLASYLPLIGIGLLRIITALIADPQLTVETVTAQHLALGWQVVLTAFAVADRFVIIKRERDSARTAAQLLERASERDVLTGLYNRRIIPERYDQLRAAGFSTLAVIDLDHFKKVNDTYGHSKGDEVLRVVAKALEPNRDTVVIRMGGEEFALLLRGRGALERAEYRRLAITRTVAAAMDFDHRVTASMGVIEVPQKDKYSTSFDALYERADRLLYDAKSAGRDCTRSERLTAFIPRRGTERRKRQPAFAT